MKKTDTLFFFIRELKFALTDDKHINKSTEKTKQIGHSLKFISDKIKVN